MATFHIYSPYRQGSHAASHSFSHHFFKTQTQIQFRRHHHQSLPSNFPADTLRPLVLQLAETLEDSLPSSSSPFPSTNSENLHRSPLLSTPWPSRRDETFRFTDVSFHKTVPNPPNLESRNLLTYRAFPLETPFTNVVIVMVIFCQIVVGDLFWAIMALELQIDGGVCPAGVKWRIHPFENQSLNAAHINGLLFQQEQTVLRACERCQHWRKISRHMSYPAMPENTIQNTTSLLISLACKQEATHGSPSVDTHAEYSRNCIKCILRQSQGPSCMMVKR
ncbi:Protein ABCI7, chloroplastic, partial [Cucurbita argyrosperma subsp. argyrosperma]